MAVADRDDAAYSTDEAAPMGGFETAGGWVVDDAFEVGVGQIRHRQAGGDDRAGRGLAQVVERVDADRDRQQRAGAEPVGGRGGRPRRHLDEGVGAALGGGA